MVVVGEVDRSPWGSRVITIFTRSPNGLNFGGMEAQVLRPMITAFATLLSSGAGGWTRLVVRAKYAISAFSRQGRPPDRPMPRWVVAATMRVRGSCGVVGGIFDLLLVPVWSCSCVLRRFGYEVTCSLDDYGLGSYLNTSNSSFPLCYAHRL